MPLDIDTFDSELVAGTLVQDPNIINAKSVNLKVCAHSSGAVYIFYIHHLKPLGDTDAPGISNLNDCTSSKKIRLKYAVNLLHHNKTLVVESDLEDINTLPLKMDVSIFANGMSR